MTPRLGQFKPAEEPLPPMSEKAWQQKVMDTAKLFQWRVVHIRGVEVAKGRWAVPYEGHAGLPDLILARPDRGVILVELKAENGRLTLDQQAWLAAAGGCGYCWRPSDWPAVFEVLKLERSRAA